MIMKSSMLKTLSRRHFLAGTVLTCSAVPFARVQAQTTSNKVGELEVITVSDGNLQLPMSFLFPGQDVAELEKLYGDEGQTFNLMAKPPLNITLVKSGDQTVIIDTGAGTNFMDSAGKLADSLQTAGIDPASVTKVVFTHAHPDHLWGTIDDFDDSERFANATYVIGAKEWDYWNAADLVDKTPDEGKGMAVGTQRILKRLEAKIERLNAGATIVPGLTFFETHGHIPGHMSVLIESGNSRLMVLGDSINNAVVNFAKPDWPFGPDMDKEQATKTRLRLLSLLATDKLPVIGYHFPQGGLGRVEKRDVGYRFVVS
jgi:glyoxylase-like metal-dependent hydrolase (beta-lactamase superfamily II)